MNRLDWRAVATGALVAMAVGVPVATIASVVLDDDSNAVFPFAVVTIVGFLLGGWVAGARGRPTERAMAHGAVAAFAGFVVAQAVAALLQVVRDEDLSPVAIVFNALLAAAVGLLGGWLAGRRSANAPVRSI